MSAEWIWKGESNRPLGAYRPCECGCDYSDGIFGVGYLSASDDDGNGFTIWIEDERIFALLKGALSSAKRIKKTRTSRA